MRFMKMSSTLTPNIDSYLTERFQTFVSWSATVFNESKKKSLYLAKKSKARKEPHPKCKETPMDLTICVKVPIKEKITQKKSDV